MPRTCTVCTHDEGHAINVALVQREPYRHIASQFGVSTGALQRHGQEHIPQLLVKASAAQEIANADDLLDKLRGLVTRAEGILDKAEEGGELTTALSAIREVRGNLELLARLLGELQEGTTVNIVNAPQWIEVRGVIVRALDPYPDAREAVVEALEGVNGG